MMERSKYAGGEVEKDEVKTIVLMEGKGERQKEKWREEGEERERERGTGVMKERTMGSRGGGERREGQETGS